MTEPMEYAVNAWDDETADRILQEIFARYHVNRSTASTAQMASDIGRLLMMVSTLRAERKNLLHRLRDLLLPE